MKRAAKWMALLSALAGGSMLLQTSVCAEQAAVATAIASAVTAGGVLYLVSRVLNN